MFIQEVPYPLYVYQNPLADHGFHSIVVTSSKPSPRNLMLGGRRQDLKAVFDSLPVGSLWNVVQVHPEPLLDLMLLDPLVMPPTDLKHFNKQSEEDWLRLEQYMDMDTEESKPMSMRKIALAMLVSNLVFLAMILFLSASEPGQMSSI